LYDSIHCVFKPKNMSAETVEAEFIHLWKQTYTAGRILKRLKHTPQRKTTSLVTNAAFRIYANRIKKMMRGNV